MNMTVFNELSDALTKLIQEWGENYRIIPLEGQKEGKKIRSIIIQLINKHSCELIQMIFLIFQNYSH